jgi:hypothetical protein
VTATQARIVFAGFAGAVAVLAVWAAPRLRRRWEQHQADARARQEEWARTLRRLAEHEAEARARRQRHDDLTRLRSAQRDACRRAGHFDLADDIDAGLRRLLDEEAGQ